MANESAVVTPPASPGWQVQHVYVMAAVCLVVGLAVGYFFRGSESAQPSPLDMSSSGGWPTMNGAGVQTMPSLDQMKQMAAKEAASLQAKLQSDPNNASLLIQIGDLYKQTHQFKEAAGYYERSLAIDPKNVAIRTDMASCLYYGGDADAALAQLQQSLHYDPNDVNTLFNVGMIKLKAKKDKTGALTAWRELLRQNPKLDSKKKATVEKMIAEATQSGNS
jgi:cytochrome c-type biogenesis protein CcmH/NrfG